MSTLRLVYLILALVGAVVPLAHLIPWMQVNGADPAVLIGVWKANEATRALYYDALIAAAVLNLWIVVETYVRKDYWVLACLPVIWLIGISSALPLFLFLRTRPVR
ncbi:MAG: DUF2834 domain-containing protein [Paracoccaceae bacterium]